MALSLAHVTAGLYKGLAVGLLVSWTFTALCFTALVALNTNSTYFEIIASTTMFTFLICRLLVVWNPSSKSSQDVTVAQLIASADSGSRRGGVMATAIYNDAFTDGMHETADVDGSTTAVSVEVDKFKEQAGFDPTEMFKMIPPRVLVYFVGLLWLNFLSLGMYVLGHAVMSLKKVLTSPTTTAEKGDSDS